MWWQYALVFVGAILVDITPLPLPPAFSLMIFLQVVFGLNVWPVIVLGVIGCAIGRMILASYIGAVAHKLLTQKKNEDIRLLGTMLKTSKLKGQLFILVYTLMPLSSTPLFVAGGIAGLKPVLLLPAFTVGKFTSDSIAVLAGAYAVTNTESILQGAVSVQSVIALLVFLILMFLLLFVDWRQLFFHKRFALSFKIWRHKPRSHPVADGADSQPGNK